MKKILVIGLLILVSLGFIYAGYRLSNSATIKMLLMKSQMEERFEEPVLGVYDRQQNISQAKAKSLKHYALILNSDKNWKISENLLKDLPENIPVLLTVEMWDSSILKKVAGGDYDENIKTFFAEILNSKRQIYIRWNPEMDVPAGHYAWEMTPQHYIPAFNRFSQIIKGISPDIEIVWGPAGYPGAMESYPEDNFVDAASITLNSLTETLLNQNHDSIPYSLQRKLHRLRFIDKPVFILGSRNMDLSNFNDNVISDVNNFISDNEEIAYAEENYRNITSGKRERTEDVLLGVYDPDDLLVLQKSISIEHLFANFSDITNGDLTTAIKEVTGRGNDLLITVEPGSYGDDNTNSNILTSVSSGKHDEVLEKFYSLLPAQDHQIYIRFAHEMEIPITRYSWQSQDPIEYIKAYRYFVEFNREQTNNIEYIWGPAGDRGSLEWWPGNDVVDYVSISIYGIPDVNITDPEKQETFSKIFNRKSTRLRFINKPYFITEFGVMGDEDFQNRWLKEAAKTINTNRQIIAVSYFNNSDVPEAWGEIEPPNWKISKNTFKLLVDSLNIRTEDEI